jgi:hypothetical protein
MKTKTVQELIKASLATPKAEPRREQGKQRIPFNDSPFFHFCLKHFYQVAKSYPAKDIARIGIVVDKESGAVAFGTNILLELFSIAANPKQINPHEVSPLFLTCFKNSPDFTLALITQIRNKLAKCKPVKRAILCQIDNGKLLDPEKTERSALRKLITLQGKSLEAAAQFKVGNEGGPGRGKTVETKPSPPFKRDTKAKDAASTVGKIAKGAGVIGKQKA